jgi:hypothetical protein
MQVFKNQQIYVGTPTSGHALQAIASAPEGHQQQVRMNQNREPDKDRSVGFWAFCLGAIAAVFVLIFKPSHITEPDGLESEPKVYDAENDEFIRPATTEELKASFRAAEFDGGTGIIMIDGRRAYVSIW